MTAHTTPVGDLWRYAVEDKSAFGVTGRGVLLDLGFRARFLAVGASARGLKPGDMVQVKRSGRGTALDKLDPRVGRQRYVYAARVERVVDGDTIVAHVDLGFGVYVEMRLRLRSVDAADVGSVGGDKATRFVKRKLRPGKVVAIRTYKHDPYDRYVADVMYAAKDETNPARIFTTGRFLNEDLLKKGLAAEYR